MFVTTELQQDGHPVSSEGSQEASTGLHEPIRSPFPSPQAICKTYGVGSWPHTIKRAKTYHTVTAWILIRADCFPNRGGRGTHDGNVGCGKTCRGFPVNPSVGVFVSAPFVETKSVWKNVRLGRVYCVVHIIPVSWVVKKTLAGIRGSPFLGLKC